MLNERYWSAVGEDPISKGTCNVEADGQLEIDFEDPSYLVLSTTITISCLNDNLFFERIKKYPLKLQGQPLVLDLGSEKFLAHVERITQFSFNDDRTEMRLTGVKLRMDDNFAFVKHIQEYRWTHFERTK